MQQPLLIHRPKKKDRIPGKVSIVVGTVVPALGGHMVNVIQRNRPSTFQNFTSVVLLWLQ